MRKIRSHQKCLLIICRDFNITPDPSLDSTSHSKCSVQTLLPFIHKQNLYDAWQCFHAGEKDFTYFSSPHRIYTRINLFLVDQQTLFHHKHKNQVGPCLYASIALSIVDSSEPDMENQLLPAATKRNEGDFSSKVAGVF